MSEEENEEKKPEEASKEDEKAAKEAKKAEAKAAKAEKKARRKAAAIAAKKRRQAAWNAPLSKDGIYLFNVKLAILFLFLTYTGFVTYFFVEHADAPKENVIKARR